MRGGRQGGRVRHSLRSHTGNVRAVAAGTNGRWLACVSDDRTVRIWDVESGQFSASLRTGHELQRLVVHGRLVRDYPGVESVSLRGAISEVIRQVAIELGNGRPVPVGLRRAVLRMADLLRQEMQPSDG